MTFISALKGILGSAGIFTPILAAFGIAVPAFVPMVIPMVTGLMTAAEEAYGDGTGALKKSAVASGIAGFVTDMQKNSTGGQKETWDVITPEMISGTIDAVATVANTISKQVNGEVIFDDSKWIANRFGA